MWITIFIILYALIAISIVISILLYGAKPSKTLSWLLAIFTIPVGGMLLYLLLGRNRRKKKLIKLSSNSPPDLPYSLAQYTELNDNYVKLVNLIYTTTHFPPTTSNALQLLKDGKTTFESIFEALNKARKQIHLQYYIFEEGELANKLLALFRQKISEGVQIRLIYDGIGSFSLSRSYLNSLRAIGVEVYPFLPFKFGRFLSSVNYRNHRKIIVIDNTVAFTGGINISDKYLKGDSELGDWHDMHLKISGNAATHLNYVFTLDWLLVSQKIIEPIEPSSLDKKDEQNKMVQIVSGGPDDDFPIIEQTYFTLINKATKYLYITNPYIIPGPAIMQALQTAALSGIDVRLMISENADNKIVSWCVRSYFENLLKSGIKIYLFPDGFLHSKIIVSDDTIASIGTANLDDRSFEQNYEVNAIIYDTLIAKLLKDDFLRDSNNCHLISYEEYVQRPLIHKLKEGFGKVFSPLL